MPKINKKAFFVAHFRKALRSRPSTPSDLRPKFIEYIE